MQPSVKKDYEPRQTINVFVLDLTAVCLHAKSIGRMGLIFSWYTFCNGIERALSFSSLLALPCNKPEQICVHSGLRGTAWRFFKMGLEELGFFKDLKRGVGGGEN